MQLEVSNENRELLLAILEQTLGNTRCEVRRTQLSDYKDGLKREEANLRDLIALLRQGDSVSDIA